MSIAFESEEVQLQKLRERVRRMSDEELIKFGKHSEIECAESQSDS